MQQFIFRYPPAPVPVSLGMRPAPSFRSYPAGWNLLGGTTAWNGGLMPDWPVLYTFQTGDTSYEEIPSNVSLVGGVGVWVYFASPAMVRNAFVPSMGTFSTPLAANQWVMISNPMSTDASITGADLVYTYDPASASYSQTTSLLPGQGAWAYSNTDSVLTIAAAS
jgi:hypothetical protein